MRKQPIKPPEAELPTWSYFNTGTLFTAIIYYIGFLGFIRALIPFIFQTFFCIAEIDDLGMMRCAGGCQVALAYFFWGYRNTADLALIKKFARTFTFFFLAEAYVAFTSTNLNMYGTLFLQTTNSVGLFFSLMVGYLLAY